MNQNQTKSNMKKLITILAALVTIAIFTPATLRADDHYYSHSRGYSKGGTCNSGHDSYRGRYSSHGRGYSSGHQGGYSSNYPRGYSSGYGRSHNSGCGPSYSSGRGLHIGLPGLILDIIGRRGCR